MSANLIGDRAEIGGSEREARRGEHDASFPQHRRVLAPQHPRRDRLRPRAQAHPASRRTIAEPILKEINNRLRFLTGVGLEYLSLDRRTATLSGGEAQRIRLASQVGSGLVGACYVLDEPTIGLHQRDNDRLIATLRHLADIGNTVLVVEHDEDMIRHADHVVDIGPGPGRPRRARRRPGHRRGDLRDPGLDHGRLPLRPQARSRFPPNAASLTRRTRSSSRARGRTTSRTSTSTFPLGGFVCVTGVSGSGKSTLVNDILLTGRQEPRARHAREKAGEHDTSSNAPRRPSTGSSRSTRRPSAARPAPNPATYIGFFDDIRKVFTQTKEAKIRGYKPGRFSFNVSAQNGGGRCEACQGQGLKKIEMHFLPDVYVECEVCRGKRYNRETLDIRFRGKNIADVLDMTIENALAFFENHPKILRFLQCLHDVGLDYLTLGQPSTQLSGGEAQRIKLATELGKHLRRLGQAPGRPRRRPRPTA